MVDITSGVDIGSGVWVGIDYSPASGGTVTTYGNFQVHTFSTSGTFVVRDTLTSASIVIAGGGGGGGGAYTTNYGGGAGGAGGYVPLTMTITPDSYSITVGTGGVGGVGGAGGSVAPTNGTSSVAFGYTALGGGSGGQFLTPLSNAASGGSGGGGYSKPAGSTTSPGLTLQNATYGYGQGYDGELGSTGANSRGGGGGGAAGDGSAIPTGTHKNGVANSITGTQVYYCNGGSGGGTSGTSFTYPGPGSGGGGGQYTGGSQTGTAGNDGVVIIRYQI